MKLLMGAEISELSSFPSDMFMLNLVTSYRTILRPKSLHSVGQHLQQ